LGKDRVAVRQNLSEAPTVLKRVGIVAARCRRLTIFFKVAADKDLALIRAQHLKKGRLEKTEASENPGPFEILLAANPSDSTGWKSPTPVRPPPSLGTSFDCPQEGQNCASGFRRHPFCCVMR
jgi:hypothetical protein